jgi:hypothetical protein|tara:strand:+ start:71466 stop:72131 length:666 start_codon:yes stop_codon:yes gene_type:complete
MGVPIPTFSTRLCPEAFDGDYRAFACAYGDRIAAARLLYCAKALPVKAPDHLTDVFFREACQILAAFPYHRYSERAQILLENILVSKVVLKHWFEERGLMTATELEEQDDRTAAPEAANSNEPTTRAEPPSITESLDKEATRGRPTSAMWPRIQELVTQQHCVNPDGYSNAMASIVHEALAAEVPGERIPALSTIQAKMKRLRAVARAAENRRPIPPDNDP